MSKASDIRSLPDRTLNLLLAPVGLWGIGLVLLWLSDRTALAIPLTYFVCLVQVSITMWWGWGLVRKYEAGGVTLGEANSGVLSVCRILTASAMIPAIVFVAQDPIAASAWTAAVSIAVVTTVVWFTTSYTVKLSNRYTHVLTLALAAAALPINATGAVSLASAYGLFDTFLV